MKPGFHPTWRRYALILLISLVSIPSISQAQTPAPPTLNLVFNTDSVTQFSEVTLTIVRSSADQMKLHFDIGTALNQNDVFDLVIDLDAPDMASFSYLTLNDDTIVVGFEWMGIDPIYVEVKAENTQGQITTGVQAQWLPW